MMSYLERLFSLRGKNALVTVPRRGWAAAVPLHWRRQEQALPWSTSIRVARQSRSACVPHRRIV